MAKYQGRKLKVSLNGEVIADIECGDKSPGRGDDMIMPGREFRVDHLTDAEGMPVDVNSIPTGSILEQDGLKLERRVDGVWIEVEKND